MPEILENKLKKEYGAKSDIPYKVMNKMGVMSGNKETEKGKKMEHELAAGPLAHKKESKPEAEGTKKVHHMEVHPNHGKGGGHIATHHHVNPMHEPEQHHVPAGGMDEHLMTHMAGGEEAGESGAPEPAEGE
jgi:hypothetical protein